MTSIRIAIQILFISLFHFRYGIPCLNYNAKKRICVVYGCEKSNNVVSGELIAKGYYSGFEIRVEQQTTGTLKAVPVVCVTDIISGEVTKLKLIRRNRKDNFWTMVEMRPITKVFK